MKFLRSIRFRLALWSALVSGFVLLIFNGVSLYFLYQEHIDALDEETERFSEDLIEELEDQNPSDLEGMIGLFDLFDDRKSLHLIAVVSPDGKTLFRSSHWKKYPLDLDRERSSYQNTQSHDGDKWRVSRTKENRWLVFVGSNLEELTKVQEEIASAAKIGFPMALLLAALGGLWVAHRAMRPVAVITKAAKEIRAQGHGQRIPEKRPENDELGRLTKELNAMLTGLEASYEQSARFSADASHELNTPLSIMQGELEAALQGEAISSADEALIGKLLGETHRLKTLTNCLLLFSRSDAGTLQLKKEPVNLSETVSLLVEDMQALDISNGLEFRCEIEEGLEVQGDEILLKQAFQNLLKNAARYNRPKGQVYISLRKSPASIVARITNTGPGISPVNRNKVFDRFFREDSSRTRGQDGFGLGLALAREIVRAHGGDIILEEAQPDKTEFAINIPNP